MTGAIRMKSHGTELTMMEIRVIMMIGDYPGITATQLGYYWNRSRGAISQILKKIEAKGLIYKSLLEVCSVEELRAFYKVINCYRKILTNDPERRWGCVNQ